MSQGKQPGFSVSIPGCDAKESEKLWKKYMDDETKSSVKKEYNEMVLHNAVLKSFGNDTLNVYASFLEAEGNSKMFAYFSGKDSVFISSSLNESHAASAKLLVRNFAVYAYKAGVEEDLKAENKKLDKMKDDLKGLEKHIDQMSDQIKKKNREIDDLKKEITSFRKQEEFISEEITKQKQILTVFNGSAEAREVEEKRLKELEKDKKKTGRDIENANSKIDKNEKDIKNAEKSIEEHKDKLIPEKSSQISEQTEVVKQKEILLNNIR
jgi:peptidoglycan hydrolase CwlO-like protein